MHLGRLNYDVKELQTALEAVKFPQRPKKGEGGQEGISHYGSLKDYLLVVVYLVQILTCSSKFLQLYRAHFL